MNYLAIDTSGKNLTLVLNKDGEVFVFDDKDCGVNHSVELMPKLEQLFKEHDCDFKDLDFIACVVGAGSFTGIRIGVSTVKALCFAYKKPCLSITSFDTLAYNEKSGKTLAVIDAKHNGFYVCGYNDGEVVYPPEYVLRDRLEELLGEYSAVAVAPIDGVPVKTVNPSDGLVKAIEHKKDCVFYDLEQLNPLYVRKSQAEEGR